MTTSDADYYRHRAEQARTAAVHAASPTIRGIHLVLASRYAELLLEAEWVDAPAPAQQRRMR